MAWHDMNFPSRRRRSAEASDSLRILTGEVTAIIPAQTRSNRPSRKNAAA
jgi:hypothetical protein